MQTVRQTGRWIRGLGLCGATALGLIASEASAQPGAAPDASAASASVNAHPTASAGTAGPKEPCAESSTEKDPEAARVAFRAGQTALSEGAYARAVDLWDQAYRDDCTAHALLLNLAMAQELLGKPDDAIHTLTLFNRRSPDSPYVEANAKRIARLERVSAEKRRERARRERDDWAPADHPTRADAGPTLSLPLAVGVAGAAVTVVGAVLFVEGRSSAASAEKQCGPSHQSCDVDGLIQGERARSRAEVGGWIASAGLATVAGGLVWHFLARPERPLDQSTPPSGVSLMTDPATRGAGMAWAGRF